MWNASNARVKLLWNLVEASWPPNRPLEFGGGQPVRPHERPEIQRQPRIHVVIGQPAVAVLTPSICPRKDLSTVRRAGSHAMLVVISHGHRRPPAPHAVEDRRVRDVGVGRERRQDREPENQGESGGQKRLDRFQDRLGRFFAAVQAARTSCRGISSPRHKRTRRVPGRRSRAPRPVLDPRHTETDDRLPCGP